MVAGQGAIHFEARSLFRQYINTEILPFQMTSLFLFFPIALAYPGNMVNQNKRFAYSRDDSLNMNMAAPGVYKESMISEGKVSCDNKGLYIIGSDVSSDDLTQHSDLDGERRYTRLVSEGQIGSVPVTGGTFNVICANNGRWSYASTRNGQVFDIFEEDPLQKEEEQTKKVLVIGCGVGGLSAARAMVRNGINASDILVICKAPGQSTTDRSTGIMFFPDKTTYDASYIDTKIPGDQKKGLNLTLMLDWFENAETSLAFWAEDLGLQDWFQKPTDYQDVEGPTLKISCDTGDCGSDLTTKLGKGLEIVDGAIETVRRAPDGRFRTSYLDEGKERTIISSLLIVGAGGNGAALYPQTTHAVGNDGLALKIAGDLSLNKVGEGSCYWLPHYSLNDDDPKVEWFSLFDCEPDCGASGCDSYNKRGLAMNAATCTPKAFDTNKCGQQFFFWRNLLNNSFSQINLSVPLQENCDNLTFYKGVIDCKGGFQIGLDGASTQLNRLYASGTSAHAFTADTYISPGATIGLAIYNGWKIGLSAPERLSKFEKRLQENKKEGSVIPVLFAVATWLILFAVFSHVLSSAGGPYSTMYAYLHYFLAGTAVFLYSLSIALAASSGSAPRTHSRVGYIAFTFLWAQVIGGSWLAWQWHTYKKSYTWSGLAHRVSGITALALISAQYYSAGEPDGAVASLNSENNYKRYEEGAIVWTSFFGLLVILSFVFYYKTFEELFKLGRTNIMLESFM